MRQVKEFMVEHTKFKGQGKSSTALELNKTTAQIVNSTFLSNRKGLYSLRERLTVEYGFVFKVPLNCVGVRWGI